MSNIKKTLEREKKSSLSFFLLFLFFFCFNVNAEEYTLEGNLSLSYTADSNYDNYAFSACVDAHYPTSIYYSNASYYNFITVNMPKATSNYTFEVCDNTTGICRQNTDTGWISVNNLNGYLVDIGSSNPSEWGNIFGSSNIDCDYSTNQIKGEFICAGDSCIYEFYTQPIQDRFLWFCSDKYLIGLTQYCTSSCSEFGGHFHPQYYNPSDAKTKKVTDNGTNGSISMLVYGLATFSYTFNNQTGEQYNEFGHFNSITKIANTSYYFIDNSSNILLGSEGKANPYTYSGDVYRKNNIYLQAYDNSYNQFLINGVKNYPVDICEGYDNLENCIANYSSYYYFDRCYNPIFDTYTLGFGNTLLYLWGYLDSDYSKNQFLTVGIGNVSLFNNTIVNATAITFLKYNLPLQYSQYISNVSFIFNIDDIIYPYPTNHEKSMNVTEMLLCKYEGNINKNIRFLNSYSILSNIDTNSGCISINYFFNEPLTKNTNIFSFFNETFDLTGTLNLNNYVLLPSFFKNINSWNNNFIKIASNEHLNLNPPQICFEIRSDFTNFIDLTKNIVGINVIDISTNTYIENATVCQLSNCKQLDNLGIVYFELDTGTYNFDITANNYYPKSVSFYINTSIDYNVYLIPKGFDNVNVSIKGQILERLNTETLPLQAKITISDCNDLINNIDSCSIFSDNQTGYFTFLPSWCNISIGSHIIEIKREGFKTKKYNHTFKRGENILKIEMKRGLNIDDVAEDESILNIYVFDFINKTPIIGSLVKVDYEFHNTDSIGNAQFIVLTNKTVVIEIITENYENYNDVMSITQKEEVLNVYLKSKIITISEEQSEFPNLFLNSLDWLLKPIKAFLENTFGSGVVFGCVIIIIVVFLMNSNREKYLIEKDVQLTVLFVVVLVLIFYKIFPNYFGILILIYIGLELGKKTIPPISGNKPTNEQGD